MRTYLDVVNETVEYYKNNPFGYDKGNESCCYFGPNGEMCAVGRCLNNPELLANKVINGDIVIEKGFGGGLKDEYLHLNNPDFWQSLQYYHDSLAIGLNSEKKLLSVESFATDLDNIK